MREPTVIDRAQVLIDSASGVEGRTTLILRFPTNDVRLNVSLHKAGRIRKLNRIATALNAPEAGRGDSVVTEAQAGVLTERF